MDHVSIAFVVGLLSGATLGAIIMAIMNQSQNKEH